MIKRMLSTIVLLSAVLLPAHAEKAPREWEAELETRFAAFGNYVATYKSASPGRKGALKITVAELRQSGAAMISMSTEGQSLLSVMRIPKGQPGAGVFYSAGGKKSVVTGFEEGFHGWFASVEKIRSVLHGGAPVRNLNWHWAAAPAYLNGNLNVSLRLQNAGEAPWLNDRLTAFATKAEERNGSVVFTLPDQSTVSIDQKTGLLAEQRIRRGTHEIVLNLEKVEVLKGIDDFLKILPEGNWKENVEQVPLGEAPMAEELSRIGAQVLMTAAIESNLQFEAIEGQLLQHRKELINYWTVTHGSKFGLLVNVRKVRILRGGFLAEYQKFVDRDPLAKNIPDFSQWLILERDSILAKLEKELSGSDIMRATRAEMKPWLPLEGVALPDRAKAVGFLKQFFDAANGAMAGILFREIAKEE